MKALVFERNIPRFVASRVASAFGSGRGAGVGPLRLVDIEPPELPGGGWHRVQPLLAGICGSDLSTVDGRSSRYFEDLVSFPFVPGHEVVGTIDTAARSATGDDLAPGARVVLEPVLGCVARGIDPPCPACAGGHTGDCERVAFGHIRPGLQTGFCADTGGGWSTAGLVAHHSQLYSVPDHLTDHDAVTVEPVACAVHAALSANITEDDVVGVLGAGMLGLATTAALHTLGASGACPVPEALIVGARYPHQRTLADELGATVALPPDQLDRALRRRSQSLAIGSPSSSRPGGRRLAGGADVIFDCVGSATSLEACLAMVRPRGRIVLVGMPGKIHVDLAPLWHREITLAGAYAYGVERIGHTNGKGNSGKRKKGNEDDGAAATDHRRTFELAFDVAAANRTGRLVSQCYPLDRFEEAVVHAGHAGRRGAVRIAFDLRSTENGGEP